MSKLTINCPLTAEEAETLKRKILHGSGEFSFGGLTLFADSCIEHAISANIVRFEIEATRLIQHPVGEKEIRIITGARSPF